MSSKSTRAIALCVRDATKEFSQESVKRVIAEMMGKPLAEVMQRMHQPDTPCIELAIGAVLMKSIRDADTGALNFLFDRSIGRVKEVVQFEDPKQIEFVTEINADGHLIQSAIECGPIDERETIDIGPYENGSKNPSN